MLGAIAAQLFIIRKCSGRKTALAASAFRMLENMCAAEWIIEKQYFIIKLSNVIYLFPVIRDQ